MNEKDFFPDQKEESELLTERLMLCRRRTEQIAVDGAGSVVFNDYFRNIACFLTRIYNAGEMILEENIRTFPIEEMQRLNRWLYHDVLPGPKGYEKSYENPDVALRLLGEKMGPLFCFLTRELRGCIAYCYEGRMEEMLVFNELFVQIACMFEREELPEVQDVRDVLYWFYHDYSDLFCESYVRQCVDPALTFSTDIVMKSNLHDLRYLYFYGTYISDTEIRTAAYLNSLSETEIRKMAGTYTEGFRKGFELAGIDLTKKRTVEIRYPIGFERMVRAAIRNFAEMGLKPVIHRPAQTAYLHKGTAQIGYTASSPNPQCDFDHAQDRAFFLDHKIAQRRCEAVERAYELFREEAAQMAGPAVIETFGETPFVPQIRRSQPALSEKQKKIQTEMEAQITQITNRYIRGEERSFTIIAWPLPDIGEKFEEIFEAVTRINTLDYEKYQRIQQHLIDVLDAGYAVHVKGCGGNRTDMTVMLLSLEDPERQTKFENCVADVNIPVGEVFTSPVLEGTNGTLHVSKVYLNGLEYRDLELSFRDGFVTDYRLANFETEEENRAYFRSNVLFDHDTLPIGEFAIGTNTAAYRMGKDFCIADKLPILIAEKTGPHFALGDTCYSHQEDMVTRNPDGKQIVARENSVSALRHTQPEKAYFSCHTDITLPFEELGVIEVLHEDGSSVDLIRGGRFVLPGTEELNGPLEQEVFS